MVALILTRLCPGWSQVALTNSRAGHTPWTRCTHPYNPIESVLKVWRYDRIVQDAYISHSCASPSRLGRFCWRWSTADRKERQSSARRRAFVCGRSGEPTRESELATCRKFVPAARNYAAARLEADVGLRVNEIRELDLDDVRWELGRFGKLNVRHGKGARRRCPKPRLVPLINGA